MAGRWWVWKALVLWRCLLLLVVVASDWLVPNHAPDGAEELEPHHDLQWPATLFVRWDSVHFWMLSEHGYVNDYQYAFFPLFPGVISFLRVWCGSNCTVWLVIFFNTLCHGLAAEYLALILQYLSIIDVDLALWCFIINPSSALFVSLYTESLFSALTFAGLYYCLCTDRISRGAVCLFVASCTRSNGLLHCLTIGVVLACQLLRRQKVQWTLLLPVLASVVPYVAWNWFTALRLCGRSEAVARACDSLASRVLMPYSQLQRHYWQVYPLAQWTPRQLPNMLIALPVAFCVASYLRSQIARRSCVSGTPERIALDAHLLVSLLFALTHMHFQVLPRFLGAASPVFWVSVSRAVASRASSEVAVALLLLYAVGGTVLHCNGYPWT